MSVNRPGSVNPRSALGQIRRVLLLESQPDHAELIRCVLTEQFPDAAVVVWPAESAAPPESVPRPDAVLLSLNVDHEEALALLRAVGAPSASAPPIFVLRGPGERWPESARRSIAGLAELDKMKGAAFLAALTSALADVAAGNGRVSPATPRSRTAPAPPCALPVDAALVLVEPGGKLCRVDHLAGRPTDAEGRPLAAGETLASLIGLSLHDIPVGRLVQLSSVPDLAACRLTGESGSPAGRHATVLLVGRRERTGTPRATPEAVRARLIEGTTSDAVSRISALAGSLQPMIDAAALAGEGEGRALDAACAGLEQLCEEAERLCRMRSPSGPPRRHRIGARILLSLREPVWRRWCRGARITTRIEPRLPVVEAAPEVLGPWLDGLVASLAAWAGDGGTLQVELARPPSRPGDPLDDPCAVERGRIVHLTFSARPATGGDTEAPQRATSSVDGWHDIGSLVAEWHGGRFEWSAAEDGSGRDAVLTLPAAPRRPAVAREERRPPAILVVDDDPGVRRVMARLLDSLDCRGVEAESGEHAVDLMRAGCRYDLVLLDMMMDGIDGAETFQRLRGLDPGVRAVFCSGSPGASGLRRGLAAGALGFVAKPVGLGALAELVGMASARRVGPPRKPISAASR